MISNNWKKNIETVVEMPPLTPFHPSVISFLQMLSKTILKDHTYRSYPELIALAYWLRKAHIQEMKDHFLRNAENNVHMARGVALHFAPSNVDTIFVYSWVLSLLAGNNNILRISGRKQDQTELLINAVLKALNESKEIADRTAIVTYEHNDEITQYLSERCHVRVIWGGDQTVRLIRSIPLSPLATELVFPDRFSLSVFDAKAVTDTNVGEMREFIHRFYNDGFWFSQMACSSPRMIVWVGEEERVKKAQSRFWEQLDIHLNTFLNEISSSLQVQKLTTGYLLSTKESVVKFEHKLNFSRLVADSVDDEMRDRHCGGGLFIETVVPELIDLVSLLQDKDQTLSYFGFSHQELIRFAKNMKNRSIDRIVPVGQALDFEGVWDGYDLLRQFTRQIVIR